MLPQGAKFAAKAPQAPVTQNFDKPRQMVSSARKLRAKWLALCAAAERCRREG